MDKKENSFTQKIGGVNFIVNIKSAEDATQEAEENTEKNDKNHSAGEKFWEDSESSLLKALIAYLYS